MKTDLARWELAVADPVICYVLVRIDVPDFQWGKTAAQTHHCGSQMTEEKLERDFEDLNTLYDEWLSDPVLELAAARAIGTENEAEALCNAAASRRYFGTVLTLAVTAAEMRQTVSMAKLLNFHAGITHDPTYPIRLKDGDVYKYVTAPIDTCAYVFGRKSALAPVLGQFDLLNEHHIVR